MDINDRLQLLEAVRRADQADAAYNAAGRACARASQAAVDALTDISRCEQQLAATRGRAQRRAAADVLEAARATYADRGRRKQTAKAKLRRAFTAARTANRELATLYAPHARSRGTGGRRRSAVAASVLDELAAMPLELIRAADALVIQSSAGKDSLVMLHRLATWAARVGCKDKVVVVHCDLGDTSEWPGVRELAERQAERYGLRFVAVDSGSGLLGLVEKRGMFPDAARRLCTSSLKRDKANVLLTEIVAALRLDRQAIVINCLGIRAAESTARSKKLPLSIDTRTSNGKRLVLTWHPIFTLSNSEVWEEIAAEGLEYHPIYDTLLPRLSCVYCVLAGPDALVLATRACFALGLSLPTTYVALEQRIGHTFKQDLRLSAVVAAARMLDALDGQLQWARGDAIRHQLGEGAAADYLNRLALAA
ncbi:phosphoadenosine phosphosulfate reductase family protein [Streptomyces sp. V1I6]|uniref:phosphoadenosine phosphosulfate reductase family protein n=1 Tax=Streptomyces sp. V1I6 TaxID=3042273 RepID=UPI0027824E10|nr:phosphoadenosine phosphosulfate reductase family protein [Streptomyces sp. V1I6]MDQ0847772.1 3'-phosphoadenosine 5'-phosphosulfate sulfotransferase (PAPS reductase)/FAD synthetase [Streptomyces sp. V1I6]